MEPRSPPSGDGEKSYARSSEELSSFTDTAGMKTTAHAPDRLTRTATVMPLQSSSKSQGVDSNTATSGTAHLGSPANKNMPALPRKPITPYMRYRNMIFEEIKHKYPGCSPYDLACVISSKWSMLTDSERKVWEDQYENDMKDYNDNLKKVNANPSFQRDWMQEKKTPAHLLSFVENISLRIEPQSPAHTKVAAHDDAKGPRAGTCNWCKRCGSLQDFTSTVDGREIYCTGLCSEKCFLEAAKQICSMEHSTNKPRYMTGGHVYNSREEPHYVFPSTSHYQPGSNSEGFQVFDWDQYLIDTQSSAATWMYFKQARHPPPNNFVVGMKLEACSNSNSCLSVYSLATVVAVCGARMLLHFDGTESNTDIWRLPDSADIHPVGWTEGSLLKAPMGYKYDPAKYSKFFASSLQNAEIAPARFFKKEPSIPIENYFGVGMKVEAVNKQNAAVIGIATVVKVEADQIRIEFDGYKGTAYWCHYTDRDLFPAGWCARAGHPLQAQGNKVNKLIIRPSQNSPTPPLSGTSSEPRSQSASPFHAHSTPQRETAWKEKSGSPNNVEVFINSECYCGPYLESRKLEQIPSAYRGNIVTVLKNILEDTIKCAPDRKTVFGFLKPGRGNCVITAVCDGVTYNCCLSNIERVSTFWRVLEQFSDNLRCCPNLFSSTKLHITCNRCSNRSRSVGSVFEHNVTRQIKRPTSHSYGYTNYISSRTDSTPTQVDLRKGVLRQESSYTSPIYSTSAYDSPRGDNKNSRSQGLLSTPRQDSVFELSRPESDGDRQSRQERSLNTSIRDRDSSYDQENDAMIIKTNVDETPEEPSNKKRKVENNLAGGVEVQTAPKSWNIDDVVSFIQQTDLKDYVSNFKENEIDGKALLLLQRDLVLSHMGFKLGPAVKLLDLIDELKTAQEKFQ